MLSPVGGFLLGMVTLYVLLAGVSAAETKSVIAPPSGLRALEQPVTMPSFNLPSVTGDTLDSATLQGKVVIVRFWATW